MCIIIWILFASCMCVLMYPCVASSWNAYHQAKQAEIYDTTVSLIDEDILKKEYEEAVLFNEALLEDPAAAYAYEDMLNMTEEMAVIEIPVIDVKLPVLHGTDKDTLKKCIGHLEGTSLPVGGKGTHCVLTGHTGLPGAVLFTDLIKLDIKDVFIIHVLHETLVYQIDQIKVVKPDDLNDLYIDPEEDYITLVTCTPYGVNDHRLLVRGMRSNEGSVQEDVHEVSLSFHQYVERICVVAGCILCIKMMKETIAFV